MNLYLINVIGPYTPPTWHGGWTSTVAGVARGLDILPWAINGQASPLASFTGTGPRTMGLLRVVSRRLAPQTITGTLDVIAGVSQTVANADFVWKCYAWVTVGDSDTVRGVVLDYTEVLGVGGATEWPTTRTGTRFAAAQALTPVNALEGDRLVVELGISTTTAINGTYSGSIQMGAWGYDGAAFPVLTNGETPTTDRAGVLVYSGTLAISASEVGHLSPDTAIPMTVVPFNDTSITTTFGSEEVWYRYTAPDRGALACFAGRLTAAPYDPTFEMYTFVGGVLTYLFTATQQSASMPLTLGTTYAMRVMDATSTQTGTLVWQARVLLGVPADLNGYLLIPADSGTEEAGSAILDPTTGETVAVFDFPPGETGACIGGTINRLLVCDKVRLDTLWLYSTEDLTVVAPLVGSVIVASGQANPPIAASADTFYVGQRLSSGTWRVRAVAPSTGAVIQTWDLPPQAESINSLGVTQDNTIAYLARYTAGAPIIAWDLVNNVALPDLFVPAPGVAPSDVLVLHDGTTLTVASVPPVDTVVRYDAAGTLLHTYSPEALPGYSAYFIDHIQIDDDPGAFWVWLQFIPPDGARLFAFVKYRVADGVVLDSFEQQEFDDGSYGPIIPAGSTPTTFFGAPNSCPLITLLVGDGPGPPDPPDPPNPGYGLRTVPQRRLRRATHVGDEQRWMVYDRFQVDLQTGVGLNSGQGRDPQVMVRWSNDAGHTWSHEHWVSAGRMGERHSRVLIRRTGRARTRTFEVVVTDPVAWYLAAAYLDISPGNGT